MPKGFRYGWTAVINGVTLCRSTYNQDRCRDGAFGELYGAVRNRLCNVFMSSNPDMRIQNCYGENAVALCYRILWLHPIRITGTVYEPDREVIEHVMRDLSGELPNCTFALAERDNLFTSKIEYGIEVCGDATAVAAWYWTVLGLRIGYTSGTMADALMRTHPYDPDVWASDTDKGYHISEWAQTVANGPIDGNFSLATGSGPIMARYNVKSAYYQDLIHRFDHLNLFAMDWSKK